MPRNILIAFTSVVFAVFVMPVPFRIAPSLRWTAGFWAAVGAAVAVAFLREVKKGG